MLKDVVLEEHVSSTAAPSARLRQYPAGPQFPEELSPGDDPDAVDDALDRLVADHDRHPGAVRLTEQS